MENGDRALQGKPLPNATHPDAVRVSALDWASKGKSWELNLVRRPSLF